MRRGVPDVLGPKLPHDPLNIIGAIADPIGLLVAERTHAYGARQGIIGVWRKGRIRWLMNDALRGNIELVAPD
jgi:hypothetical protein